MMLTFSDQLEEGSRKTNSWRWRARRTGKNLGPQTYHGEQLGTGIISNHTFNHSHPIISLVYEVHLLRSKLWDKCFSLPVSLPLSQMRHSHLVKITLSIPRMFSAASNCQSRNKRSRSRGSGHVITPEVTRTPLLPISSFHFVSTCAGVVVSQAQSNRMFLCSHASTVSSCVR